MRSNSLKVMQIVNDLDVGGAQEVVRTLVENLSLLGCTPVVCAFKDGPLRQDIEALGIPVEILPERRYSVFSLPSFLYEIIGYRKLLNNIVKKYQIDIIQTHILRSMDFLVLSLKSQHGPKVFWTFHNELFDLREDHLDKYQWLLKPKRLSHHLLYRIGSKWVDGIIAVSQDVKTALIDTMRGIPSEKITVICNSVDVQRYIKDFNRDQIRHDLGFNPITKLGIVVATFKKQKGHQYLIKAASRVTDQYPNFHLLFVGDGELREELKSLTKKLNLEDHIHFLGTRRDIASLLAASDLFILPSLWEGLPMALIEAMASEMPIVATDVSGTKQAIIDGISGILVRSGNSRELEFAIRKILDDSKFAKKMGKSARFRVESSYSAKNQALESIKLFKNFPDLASIELSLGENQV